jgi:hypothetical protein
MGRCDERLKVSVEETMKDQIVVYYKSRKRDLKAKLMNESVR